MARTRSSTHLHLESLPPEILSFILSFVSPQDLARLSAVSRRIQTFADDEHLWSKIVRDLTISTLQELPQSCKSWKSLYAAHDPYWFIPRHKIWFSDRAGTGSVMTGMLCLSCYDLRTGNIEAYRVVATPQRNFGALNTRPWSHNPSVTIHEFKPSVGFFLDDPVVKITPESHHPGRGRLKHEISLQRPADTRSHGVRARIFLAKPMLPLFLQEHLTFWPPRLIPAEDRVLTENADLFRSDYNKPSSRAEMSQTTFRIRKWMQFSGLNGRIDTAMGEDVSTFSTLDPSLYVPTAEKPYQGIYIGDYSGHGCEFLLIMQHTPEEVAALPQIPVRMITELSNVDSPDINQIANTALQNQAVLNDHFQDSSQGSRAEGEIVDEPPMRGRLIALKLTGDPHVPRGEISFMAPDLGHKGLVRIAQEEEFRGARIVKSVGHVAARGFVDDAYMTSQLMLCGEDTIAQFWEDFGHISFYKKLDIESLLERQCSHLGPDSLD